MEDEERDLFMADLGIEALGLDRLIQATYKLLGLQTYYTAGEKEIRAWTTATGSKAPQAAGVIHTDFEKAFIRAEVYAVEDPRRARIRDGHPRRGQAPHGRPRLRHAGRGRVPLPDREVNQGGGAVAGNPRRDRSRA